METRCIIEIGGVLNMFYLCVEEKINNLLSNSKDSLKESRSRKTVRRYVTEFYDDFYNNAFKLSLQK